MSFFWRESELNKLSLLLIFFIVTEAVFIVILLLCSVMFLVFFVQFIRIVRLSEKVKFLGSVLYRLGKSSSVYSFGRTDRGRRTFLLIWGVGVVRFSYFLMIGMFFFIYFMLVCVFSIVCCVVFVVDLKFLFLMKFFN